MDLWFWLFVPVSRIWWWMGCWQWQESRVACTFFTWATGWLVIGTKLGRRKLRVTEGNRVWWFGSSFQMPFGYANWYTSVQERVRRMNTSCQWTGMRVQGIDGLTILRPGATPHGGRDEEKEASRRQTWEWGQGACRHLEETQERSN